MEVPAEPVLFMKATSAICGPFDEVLIPPGSEKTDWEVELGVVIGTKAKHGLDEVPAESGRHLGHDGRVVAVHQYRAASPRVAGEERRVRALNRVEAIGDRSTVLLAGDRDGVR